MEAENIYIPVMAEVPGKADRQEELVMTDENAGQKIKDTADRVGVFGSIGALILGFVIWNHTGFLMGFLFASVCTVASWALYCLFYSYGDAVCIAIEQAKVLKKLEAEKKNSVLPAAQQPLGSDTETIDVVDEDGAELVEPQEADQDVAEELLNAVEDKRAETESMTTDLPVVAYAYDQMKRTARFTERSRFGAICPVCGKWQTTKDDICFHCSCIFHFDDERRDASRRTA